MTPPVPRRHRRNYNDPGHAHELTFSCYHRFPFLARDLFCQWFLDSLEQARRLLEFDIWAYVLMPEHVHLIVRPRRLKYDIAVVRRAIKEPVSRKAIRFLCEQSPEWIPKITRQRGGRIEHLFWQSGGGYDRNITEPATLLQMIDYLHLNPVRRGLAEKAVDWRWSSAAWFLGYREVPFIPDAIPSEWRILA